MRWTSGRKADLVKAVEEGFKSIEDVCQEHDITIEEFNSWQNHFKEHGAEGLKTTKLQRYRPINLKGQKRAKIQESTTGVERPKKVSDRTKKVPGEWPGTIRF